MESVAYNIERSSVERQRALVSPEKALRVMQSFNNDGSTRTLMRALKTEWIQRLIYLDGKPFNFAGRDYLKKIYNSNYPVKLLKTARQVEKTTMLANELIINSIITSFWKSIYVSPSFSQTRAFSNQKLKPWISGSPIIAKFFQSTQVSQQVLERGFTNGSMAFLRAAFLTADRVRGLSGDQLFVDEIQDILSANLAVIQECLSHAANPSKIYSGTPKTLDNLIETLWVDSTQNEFLVRCERHAPTHWNYLDEKCIGKQGPICNKCGQPIDPNNGQWFAFQKGKEIAGFRIAQLMVPWYQNPSKWRELLFKYETYSKGVFYNEVLGISYDSGSKPVTRTELMACCSSKYPFHTRPSNWSNRVQLFFGIDWGEGTDGSERTEKGKIRNASYTILTIGTYIDPHRFHILYYRRFEGQDALPGNCVREIIQTLRDFRVVCGGVDWGHGWGVNERLEDALGPRKVIKFQYVSGQRERKKYDDIGIKYQLNRTHVMSDFFQDIKDQKFIWSDWEAVKNYLCDIENIYSEYRESSRSIVYDHRPSNPDDACHATILCREAADNFFGKLR